MKKNVASQKVGAQMVTAADGSAFTGSVTVYVTGDAGTQAVGSVGSGACTHEGNGYHTYAPAQAETNYDLVAFTFTGTGAVPQTVQMYTTFPQTGDSYATVNTNLNATVSSRATQTSVDTIDDLLDTEVAAIFDRIGAPINTSISQDLQDAKAILEASIVAATVGLSTFDPDTNTADGVTWTDALVAIMAALLGVADPLGTTVRFKKRDGTTTFVTITYGADDGERLTSVIG